MISENKSLVCQREQYPYPANAHYLNCATRAPLSKAVVKAGIDAVNKQIDPMDLTPDDFFFGSSPASMQASGGLPGGDTMQLEDVERRLIQQAMQKHGGNITDVARQLGLSRQALYRRMEKYGF